MASETFLKILSVSLYSHPHPSQGDNLAWDEKREAGGCNVKKVKEVPDPLSQERKGRREVRGKEDQKYPNPFFKFWLQKEMFIW